MWTRRCASTTSEGGFRSRIDSVCVERRSKAQGCTPCPKEAHPPRPPPEAGALRDGCPPWRAGRGGGTGRKMHPEQRPDTQPSTQNPTTSFLTATALAYAIGAGITAAAGTRLALQSLLSGGFNYHSLDFPLSVGQRKSYFSSLPRQCRHWVICAPAANLSCVSRLSGSLSGIEPWFSVTRNGNGCPRHNHQADRAEIRPGSHPRGGDACGNSRPDSPMRGQTARAGAASVCCCGLHPTASLPQVSPRQWSGGSPCRSRIDHLVKVDIRLARPKPYWPG